MSRLGLTISIALLLHLATSASAHELTTTVGIEAKYNDNIRRIDEENPSDELSANAFVAIDYQYDFADVEADFNYVARRYDFRDETFDNRTDLIGTTSVNWTIVPQRFSWQLSHNRNRVLTDQSAAAIPTNEQDRKTFVTGPQFQLNLSPSSTMFYRGNFVDNRAEADRSFKSTQTRGEFQFVRQFRTSQIAIASLRSNVNIVESDQDYNSERISLSYSGLNGGTSWELSIGNNDVERQNDQNTSGLFYSGTLKFTRKNANIAINSNRELTDSQLGLTLNDNVLDQQDNGDGNLAEFDIVERTRHELAYSQTLGSMVFNYTVIRDIQDFQSLNRDQTTQQTAISLRFNQSATLSWNFQFIRASRTFQVNGEPDARSRQYRKRLTMIAKLNSKLTTEVWVSTNRRRVDSGSINNFRDEELAVKLTYRI